MKTFGSGNAGNNNQPAAQRQGVNIMKGNTMNAMKRRLFVAVIAIVAGTGLTASAAVLPTGPLSGAYTIDGTSGSTTNTGDRTLSGSVTFTNGFFVEYLIVGGGGGGSGGSSGGGGGGGGVVTGNVQLANSSYAVTVGAGGTGGTAAGANATKGANSTFAGLTAYYGGQGGFTNGPTSLDGASGGGGASSGAYWPSSYSPGGAAIYGAQGSNGGRGYGANLLGGGGGGAGGAGADATLTRAGNGGLGFASSISGTSMYYGGGGGGGAQNSAYTAGTGGSGVGGNGSNTGNATAGLANSGGGGGGAGYDPGPPAAKDGGNGGSGIVIVRYEGGQAVSGGAAGTGSALGYWVHQYTTVGNTNFDMSTVNLSTRLGAVITNVLSGSGSLTWAGPGSLTLGGANTYNGTTTVSVGTLKLGASGSIANSAVINVGGGTTFDVSALPTWTLGAAQTLKGTGTVKGNTIIAGTHSPGNSPGLQTFNGSLTYNSGANVPWELTSNGIGTRGTTYDGIDVTGSPGTLTFNGFTTTLSLAFNSAGSGVLWSNPFWTASHLGTGGWLVYDATGGIIGFNNLSLNAPSNWYDSSNTLLSSGQPSGTFSLFQSGNDIYLQYEFSSAAPEPSTLLLLAVGGLVAWRQRRQG